LRRSSKEKLWYGAIALVLFGLVVLGGRAFEYNQDVAGSGSAESRFEVDRIGDVARGDGDVIVIGHKITDSPDEETMFSGFQMNGTRGTFRVWGQMGDTSHWLDIRDATDLYATAAFRSSWDETNLSNGGGSSSIEANFTGSSEEEVISLETGCKGTKPIQIGDTELSGTFQIKSEVVV